MDPMTPATVHAWLLAAAQPPEQIVGLVRGMAGPTADVHPELFLDTCLYRIREDPTPGPVIARWLAEEPVPEVPEEFRAAYVQADPPMDEPLGKAWEWAWTEPRDVLVRRLRCGERVESDPYLFDYVTHP